MGEGSIPARVGLKDRMSKGIGEDGGFRGYGVTRQVGVQSTVEGEVTKGPQDVLGVPREPYPGSGSPGHCLYHLGTGKGGPGGPQWGPPVRRES